jgi:hypothetical protein
VAIQSEFECSTVGTLKSLHPRTTMTPAALSVWLQWMLQARPWSLELHQLLVYTAQWLPTAHRNLHGLLFETSLECYKVPIYMPTGTSETVLLHLVCAVFITYVIWYNISVNCNWVATRGSSTVHKNDTENDTKQTIHRTTLGSVLAVPRLCWFYPGICLTTEEKARKTLSQSSHA